MQVRVSHAALSCLQGSPPRAAGTAWTYPLLHAHLPWNTTELRTHSFCKEERGKRASTRDTWWSTPGGRTGSFPLLLSSPAALGFKTQTTQARSPSWTTPTWGHTSQINLKLAKWGFPRFFKIHTHTNNYLHELPQGFPLSSKTLNKKM